MSAKLRKLAKRVNLTKVHAGATKHGCESCREQSFRQAFTREVVERGVCHVSHTLTCPLCSSVWRVTFGADSAGGALVYFAPVVLS